MNNRTVDRCDYNVGEYINNRYRVSQTLGEGSFGKVYRVTDSASKDYALKLLRLWEVPPEIRVDAVRDCGRLEGHGEKEKNTIRSHFTFSMC